MKVPETHIGSISFAKICWLLKCQNHSHLISNTVLAIEAVFTKNCIINLHNTDVWADEDR